MEVKHGLRVAKLAAQAHNQEPLSPRRSSYVTGGGVAHIKSRESTNHNL
jgi:hypothetical protein